MGSADCGRDKEELVGGGEVGRLLGGPMIGVNFAATLQKSSKLSAFENEVGPEQDNDRTCVL